MVLTECSEIDTQSWWYFFFLDGASLLISVRSLKIPHVTHKNREQVVTRGLGLEELGRCLRVQLATSSLKSSGDLMYSIESLVNNTVL